MKNIKFTLAALSVAFIFTSCEKEAIQSSGSDVAYALPGCGEAVKRSSSYPLDPAGINSVSISGHCADVNITYGGGCQTHRFDLVWDGLILESFPPQLNLQLHHDSNGDLCKALITGTHNFNLRKVEIAGYSSVILNFYNPNGTLATSVVHNY